MGTRFFKGEADLGQMLRAIGFAFFSMVLSTIPCVGGVIGIIWPILVGSIFIRQGLDLDDVKAFLTVVVGAVFYITLTAILNAFL